MATDFDPAAAGQRVFGAVARQAELARAMGVTPSAVSNLKRRRTCTLGLVLAAAQVTGRPVDWFLFGRARAGAPRKGLTAKLRSSERRIAALEARLRVLERRLAEAKSGRSR